MQKKDFHKLIRLAKFHVAGNRKAVLTASEMASQLVLIVDGNMLVDLGNEVTVKVDKGIIGEMAYLNPGGKASATVYADRHCSYYAWQLETLSSMKKAAPLAARGLELVIGRELWKKLSHTTEQYKKEHALLSRTTQQYEKEHKKFICAQTVELLRHQGSEAV